MDSRDSSAAVSSARNAASPSCSNISRTLRPSRSCTSVSRSTKGSSSRSAARRPTVDLPAPMNPMSRRWLIARMVAGAQDRRHALARCRPWSRVRTCRGMREPDTSATSASATTAAAGTAHTSLRSRLASTGSSVSRSTLASGVIKRRDRLHGRAHDELLAVGHPALETTGAVGAAGRTRANGSNRISS